MIEIKDLSVSYGSVNVLDKLSLCLNDGELYALVGPSGCGKSTLLKALCGINTTYSGQIKYNGVPISDIKPRIGYVPQNYGLLDWKTVRENIHIPSILSKKRLSNEILISEIATILGIKGLYDRYPQELSGGEKQRVALARAFGMGPELLLMDEPFSALDAFTSSASQRLFLKIWSEHRVTALFITHNISEAVSTSKKIIIIDKKLHRVANIIDNHTFGKGSDANIERMELVSGITRLFEGDL